MVRAGLAGLGNVGSGFARKLREAGFPLSVFDIKPQCVKAAAELGAIPTAGSAQVADQSDVILLSLPGNHVVEAVMEGGEGVLDRLRAGQLVIDTGTSRPETDIRYQKLCAERGAGFLDAPTTGRSAGWVMMVGGGRRRISSGAARC
jgi:3-hydroxyisobutyrate dehydrogenase-like beta-hydroxyacid dehydrogenase